MKRQVKFALAAATLLATLAQSTWCVAQQNLLSADSKASDLRLAEAILVTEVNQLDIKANLYRPASASPKPFQAVLVLGGSEGAFRGGMPAVARSLAQNGFAAMHLAYFGLPGLPNDLELIPIEYFRNAITWLLKQDNVRQNTVAVVGVSKGSEAALILAVEDSRIVAVVAGAPSSYVWPGLNACDTGASSWTLQGLPMKVLPCGTGPSVVDTFTAYSAGLQKRAEYPEAAIPIEKSAAKVLLVCGESDTLNPACTMARELEDRASKTRNVTSMVFPNAGHLSFGVPVAASHPNFERLASLGGTAVGNAKAREQGWPAVIEFLKSTESGMLQR